MMVHEKVYKIGEVTASPESGYKMIFADVEDLKLEVETSAELADKVKKRLEYNSVSDEPVAGGLAIKMPVPKLYVDGKLATDVAYVMPVYAVEVEGEVTEIRINIDEFSVI